MSNSTRIYVIRMTHAQVVRLVEILVKAGDMKLANKILSQASKARG